MLRFSNDQRFFSVAEDLSLLEFGGKDVPLFRSVPLLTDFNTIPVKPEHIKEKSFRLLENGVEFTLRDFYFPARFPGNDYCRPDKQYVPDFSFKIAFELEENDLICRITALSGLENAGITLLVLPDFFKHPTSAPGSFILPVNYGIRVPFPRQDVFSEVFEQSCNWSLPVHGLFTASGGIGLCCEDPDADYKVSFNTDLSRTASVLCRQHFSARTASCRCMRFTLFAAGSDFQSLALFFRKLRQRSGRFLTLKEKMERHPETGLLPGSVVWKHNVFFKNRPPEVRKSYSLYVARPDWNENEGLPGNWTAKEIFDTAERSGFDRVAVLNTGWNIAGFDAAYPERLPVNPLRGTEQEFKAAAAEAKKRSAGFLFSVHDNYADAYEGAAFRADEMLQLHPGVPCKSAIYRGGQTYFLCPAKGLEYAKRDLPEIAELTGRGVIYLDVTAAVPNTGCCSAQHPLSRQEDLHCKRELFLLAKELFGALAVESCGTDRYADLVDIGAYGALHFGFLSPATPGPFPIPVPLWQMVYHDSVMNYFGEGYSPVHGSEYRLYQALYNLLPTAFDEHSRTMSFQMRECFTEPMTAFEELIPREVRFDPDGSFRTTGAAKSTFGGTVSVIANFEDHVFRYAEHDIPPRSYLILKTENC